MLSGVYRFPPMESVIYGRPFAEALSEQVEQSDAHSVFLLASGTLDRETDMVEQVRRALGNRLAGVFARIGAHTPQDRCRRGGERGPRRRRRPAGHARRRLGDRRGEDGRLLPRQRCDGPGRARQLPRPGQRRRQDRAAADKAAGGPHGHGADDAVGRRIHRLGRLHRHGAAGEGELRPPADDAEERRARSARDDPHAGMAVPVDRHPCRRSRGRGHLLARNASRSRRARRITR